MPSLRVLVACAMLEERTGSELYVSELVAELARQGHVPVVWTAARGPLADEVEATGVRVLTDLAEMSEAPDVVHGNNLIETIAALEAFPQVQAVFVCHDDTWWSAEAPRHPRVRRYVGVSDATVARMLNAPGVDPELVQLSQNGVDLARFTPRAPLPATPQRALLFTNYEHDAGVTREACERLGIALTVAGRSAGSPSARPEELLRDADIVFAKARCATEALAVGCAVVVAHLDRMGPMVTSAAYPSLRERNFGMTALTEPREVDGLIEQIKRYDAADALAVRDLVRATASIEATTAHLVGIYREAIADPRTGGPDRTWWLATLADASRRMRASDHVAGLRESVADYETAWQRVNLELIEARARLRAAGLD